MTSAHDLSAQLADLLRRERAALAEFLLALAAFDLQRRWLELGHASLFYFLHRELGLSKGAAFYRMTAARIVQQHPSVIEPLRDGRLCLTSIVELSKVITAENVAEVLPRFFHLSKREAKDITAELRPDETVPRRAVVTAVRPPAFVLAIPPRAAADAGGGTLATATGATPDIGQSVHPANHLRANFEAPPQEELRRPPSATRPMNVEPKTADLNRVHVTVSRRFLEKLEAARAALSHSHPGASADEILEAGLDLLLERHAKRKGLVEKPRREPPPLPDPLPASRGEGVRRRPEHVPAHVKRAVWKRDGGRCQWPVHGGGVCGSTHRVELDHIVPRARGGLATVENTRCLCRVHNDLAARKEFGDVWMDQFTGRERAPAPGDPGPPRALTPASCALT